MTREEFIDALYRFFRHPTRNVRAGLEELVDQFLEAQPEETEQSTNIPTILHWIDSDDDPEDSVE